MPDGFAGNGSPMAHRRRQGGTYKHMSATSKIALGVASGYLLGRTKKLKLAITVGGMLAGKKIATNPQALLAQGSQLIDKNPELKKLQEQISGKLLDTAKTAALTSATNRLEGFSSSLRDGQSGSDDDEYEDEEDEYEDEPEDEDEQDAEDEPEEDEPEEEPEEEEPEEEPEPEPPPRRKSRSSGTKKSAAKKSATKKSPAKKASPKKSTAKKSSSSAGARKSAKKTSSSSPSKKSSSSSRTAKKTAAKKSSSARGGAKKTTSKRTRSSSRAKG